MRGCWKTFSAFLSISLPLGACSGSSAAPSAAMDASSDGSLEGSRDGSIVPGDDSSVPADGASAADVCASTACLGDETASDASSTPPEEAGGDAVSPEAAPDAALDAPLEGDSEAPPADAASDGLHCKIDGMQDGTETDVDCGGGCDAFNHFCADGKQCQTGPDCLSKVCKGGVCQVPTCSDGQENGQETDVDCGGPQCDSQGDRCPDGEKCLTANDCQILICDSSNRCAFPNCHDGVQNGGETGTDCGNTAVTGCPACPAGQGCMVPADCQSLDCKTGYCLGATCNDGIQNEGESDVDCGMACGLKLCASGKKCFMGADCKTGVCLSNGTCM
jgi:hypothetical protein